MDRNFYSVWYQHNKQVWWAKMHTSVANFLGYATTKYYWNWIIFSQIFVKVKRVTFFWNSVVLHVANLANCLLYSYVVLILSMVNFLVIWNYILCAVDCAKETHLLRGSSVVLVTECEEESLRVNWGFCCWCEVDCTQLYCLQWQYVISLNCTLAEFVFRRAVILLVHANSAGMVIFYICSICLCLYFTF